MYNRLLFGNKEIFAQIFIVNLNRIRIKSVYQIDVDLSKQYKSVTRNSFGWIFNYKATDKQNNTHKTTICF